MGWNTLRRGAPPPACSPASRPGQTGLHAYFVHSYRACPDGPRRHVVADTDYAGAITAVVGRDNVAGTQFHPEKSQRLGLALIGNFLRWRT